MKLNSLPSEIFELIQLESLPSETIKIETSNPEITNPIINSETNLFCTICKVQISREHYKSDWHAYNLKLSIKQNKTISEQEFDNQMDRGSISSVDKSDSDDDQPKQFNSPVLLFQLKNGKSIQVFKDVLIDSSQTSLLSFQNIPIERSWVFIMLGSGHFAAAVFRLNDGSCIDKKSFHRYTTRRKQGGSQSALDSSKGKAKSGGAQLRRYNELALQMQVKELIRSWKSYIQQAQLLFIRIPPSSKKTIFFDDSIFDPNDSRVRRFPFTTKRPTFTELLRCFDLFMTVEIRDIPKIESNTIELMDSTESDALSINSSVVSKDDSDDTESLNEPDDSLDPQLKRCIELLLKGKSLLFQTQLTKTSISINEPIPNKQGSTFLHLASMKSTPECVHLLLEMGASPIIKNESNKTAYQVSTWREIRDTFRRFMFHNPDKWDYSLSFIPSPLSPEMEQKQRDKSILKKRKLKLKLNEKNKEKNKTDETNEMNEEYNQTNQTNNEMNNKGINKSMNQMGIPIRLSKLTINEINSSGMDPLVRSRLDREKRAIAAESRIRTQLNTCSSCKKSLVDLIPFEKHQFKYCSLDCVKQQQDLDSIYDLQID